jgi:hypothetical protein
MIRVLCFDSIRQEFRALGSRFRGVGLGAVRMVRYADRSTSGTLDPGVRIYVAGGVFKFLMTVCSAAQRARNVVHCTWSAGPRYVLSDRQIPLSGGVERPKNPNPTQIQIQIRSVLSVTPLFVSTLKIVYTNELDVFCIRNEIESLRMDVDLTLHGEERRPLH